MMSGQYWPEGDEVYHAELTVPVLLVHGMHDKFVPVEEDQRMAEVWLAIWAHLSIMHISRLSNLSFTRTFTRPTSRVTI